MEYKISKESVERVHQTKFKGCVEITEEMLGEAKFSLEDFIWDAHKTALKNGIRANTVMINKRLAKVKGFGHFFAGRVMDIPPMICGLEAFVTDEIPEEFAFALVEAPSTQRDQVYGEGHKKGYEEGYEQGVEDFKARSTKYYRALTGNTLSAVVEYTITLMAKELIDKAGEASDKA